MAVIETLAEISSSQKTYKFLFKILFRSFKIFFRPNKNITLIHASFVNENSGNKESTFIKFRFRNALWYKFQDVNTDQRYFAIPNPMHSEKISLVVYGFFRKKIYSLNFDEPAFNGVRKKFFEEVKNAQSYQKEEAYIETSNVLVRN